MTFPLRPRPPKLSNGQCCYSDEQIAAIDAKPVDALVWSDFEAIFALSDCTASYDERLFYLPLALRRVEEHPDDAEILTGVVNFITSYADALTRDGFYEPAIEQLRAMFLDWTAGDKADAWDVCTLIDALLSYGLRTLAEELVETLGEMRRPKDVEWLEAFANEARRRFTIAGRSKRIDAVLDLV